MSGVVIRWSVHGYVTKRQPDYKPYASSHTDPDVKIWKSLKNAQRWLSSKDPKWASECVIESLEENECES